MNLQDYLTQENPKRMPSGSVYVPNNYIIGYSQRYDPTQQNKQLKITIYSIPMFGSNFDYLQLGGDTTLWTKDGDGNPFKRSCFSAMPIPPTDEQVKENQVL